MTQDLRYCRHEGEYSWWEKDAQGIPYGFVPDLEVNQLLLDDKVAEN